MSYKLSKALAFASFFSLAGRASADVDAGQIGRGLFGMLPIAAYQDPNAAPLPLADLQAPVQFNASLVFLDHPALGQIGGLLQKTFESRTIKDGGLKYIATDLVPGQQAVTTAQTAYAAYDARIRDAYGRVDQTARRTYVAGIANTLFDDRLAALTAEQLFTPADSQQAAAVWPGYCEAKLWELAVHPLLGRRFHERPTPLQACEAYYAQQHYFADASLCAPAADQAGKDYFACVWQAGVLKSALLRTSDRQALCAPGSTTTHEQAVTAWVSSGFLQQVLLGTNTADAAALRSAILDADLLSSSFARRNAAAKSCRLAFTKAVAAPSQPIDAATAPAPGGFGNTWQASHASVLLGIAEAGIDDQVPFNLLPAAATDAARRVLYAKLTKGIRDFAIRPAMADGTPGFSYSDTTFNQPVGTALPVNPDIEAALLGDEGFSRLREFEPAEVKTLKTAQAAALQALTQAQTQLAQANATYLHDYRQPIDANLLATASLAQQPGAAIYLNNYYLNVDRVGRELHVKLGFDLASKVLVGCTNLDDGRSCALPEAEVGANGIPVHLGYNEFLNLITIEHAIEAPADIGFPALPRAPGGVQFNEIPYDQLAGHTLRLDMLVTQSAEGLQAVTGAAFILDGFGFPHYLGTGVGDDFSQRERASKPMFQ